MRKAREYMKRGRPTSVEYFKQFIPMDKGVRGIIWERDEMRQFIPLPPHLKSRSGSTRIRKIETYLPTLKESAQILGYEDVELVPLWHEVRSEIFQRSYEYLMGVERPALKERVRIFNAYFQIFYSLFASRKVVYPHSEHPYCQRVTPPELMAIFYANYILGRATDVQIDVINNLIANGGEERDVFFRASPYRMSDYIKKTHLIDFKSILNMIGLAESDVVERKEYYKKYQRTELNYIIKNPQVVRDRFLKADDKKVIIDGLKMLKRYYHRPCRGTGVKYIGTHVSYCECIYRQISRRELRWCFGDVPATLEGVCDGSLSTE